jgi:hypothetical protein
MLRPGIVILKFVLSRRVIFLLVSSAIDWLQQLGGVQLSVRTRAMVTAEGLRRDVVRAMVTADGTHAPWLRRDVHAWQNPEHALGVCCIQCLKFVHVEHLKVFCCCTLKLLIP